MTPDLALFDLDLAPDALADCAALLDGEERARAAAFRFALHRNRFVARRGQLRRLLGSTLARDPGTLCFATGAYGKPALVGEPLHFSLSHSRDLALCAIGDAPLGCDIEYRRADLATPGIAERFFSQHEIAALAALPAEDWIDAFFNCWTRKEAFVKALGTGLSEPLDAFSVALAPGDAPRLIAGPAGWCIHGFAPAPGFTAAVVARTAFDTVACRRLTSA